MKAEIFWDGDVQWLSLAFIARHGFSDGVRASLETFGWGFRSEGLLGSERG
jgi:hypothetical protein